MGDCGEELPGSVRLGRLVYTPSCLYVSWFVEAYLPREAATLARRVEIAFLRWSRAKALFEACPGSDQVRGSADLADARPETVAAWVELKLADAEYQQARRAYRGHQELMDAAAGWYMRRTVKQIARMQCHHRF